MISMNEDTIIKNFIYIDSKTVALSEESKKVLLTKIMNSLKKA